jgi:hypothetical protein
MTDIVSRLRDAERYGQFGRSLLYGQVADEIERLRSELAESDRNVISQMVVDSDIVSRLRDAERYGQFGRCLLYDKIADEIERLRSEIATSGPTDEDLHVKPNNLLSVPNNRADLVAQLRDRACPAGLPHTGDSPKEDHGHTDCWLHHQAADEIERLLKLTGTMADS